MYRGRGNEGCISCASLAGLVLSFIVLLVIAPLLRRNYRIIAGQNRVWFRMNTRRCGDATGFATDEPTMRFFHFHSPDDTAYHSGEHGEQRESDAN